MAGGGVMAVGSAVLVWAVPQLTEASRVALRGALRVALWDSTLCSVAQRGRCAQAGREPVMMASQGH